MRTNILFSAAALGAAGLLLTAPAVSATEQVKGSIGLVPGSAGPGETVTIIGDCNAPGFTTAKVDSQGALDPVEVYLKDAGTAEMTLGGTTTVAKKAKPGVYTVSYMCGKVKVRTEFTVEGAVRKPATTAPRPSGQVSPKPKGAAETGGGDVVNTASVQSTPGPGTGTVVLGGVALVATAGAGGFAFRRMRRER